MTGVVRVRAWAYVSRRERALILPENPDCYRESRATSEALKIEA